MDLVKCTKPGCGSISSRLISSTSTSETRKCNRCGTVFTVRKTSANSSSGRYTYGDKHSYSCDDDNLNSYDSSSSSCQNSSDSDSFGDGSSDGGGSDSDW